MYVQTTIKLFMMPKKPCDTFQLGNDDTNNLILYS